DAEAGELRGRRHGTRAASRYRADRARQSRASGLLMSPRSQSRRAPRLVAPPGPRPEAGVSLLEVLITLVILTIGLLGLAGLQTVSLQLNQGALVRSQASNLAYDITERIRANWPAAAAYNIAIDEDAAASPSTLAESDLSEWREALAATLPDGTGSVEIVD